MQDTAARRVPRAGELWISRPPYLLLTEVVAIHRDDGPAIDYVLYDYAGDPLTGRLRTQLDESWWQYFRPLARREG